ncbi:hypothetical protein [Agromyces sp. NPDC056965]|uniref:hypothetical protein n=1 Tax=Agromyces sp. NPDC056965 TaxID=3345983 RepID=UPI003631D7CD
MYGPFGFDLLYSAAWVLFALTLLAVLVCLIVLLISASRALNATARWNTVRTELLLAEASAGFDDPMNPDASTADRSA